MNLSGSNALAQTPSAQQESIISIVSPENPVAPHLPLAASIPARSVQIEETPPTTAQIAIPQLGNLRFKDTAFYFTRLSVSELKEISQSASPGLRTSLVGFRLLQDPKQFP